jgi:hypothetical protein
MGKTIDRQKGHQVIRACGGKKQKRRKIASITLSFLQDALTNCIAAKLC